MHLFLMAEVVRSVWESYLKYKSRLFSFVVLFMFFLGGAVFAVFGQITSLKVF